MTRAITHGIIIALIAFVAGGCVHTPRGDGARTARSRAQTTPPEQPEPPAEAESGESSQPPKEQERAPSELITAARELSPSSTYPVRTDSTVLGAVIDADGNGELDVCLLTVNANEWEEAPAIAEVSDPRRISSEGDVVPEFFFELYLNRPDGLVLFETRRVGRFPVVERFSTRKLSHDDARPAAFTASFQDRVGHQEHWLIVGRNGISTFALQQAPTITSRVIDIDRDGIDDVLKAQSAFEQGRGNETFLTWYKWDGSAYTSHATTNIVRNLNEFFQELENHLAAGRYEMFVERAQPDPTDHGVSPDTIELIGSLFVPDESAAPVEPLLEKQEIREVAFPQILENPFPSPGERTWFTAPVRMETEDGASFFYTASVTMSANPFKAPQFRLTRVDSTDATASEN